MLCNPFSCGDCACKDSAKERQQIAPKTALYNELRNELGKAKFGKLYNECNEDEQKAIREYYPQKISEAEPKKYGGK